MKTTAIILFLALISKIGMACQVSALPIKERISKADAIFSGRILKEHRMKKKSGWLDYYSEIEVLRRFKGDIPKRVKVYYMKLNRKDGYGGSCDSREVGFGEYAGRKDEMNFFVRKEGNMFVTTGDLSYFPSASMLGTSDIKSISEILKVSEKGIDK